MKLVIYRVVEGTRKEHSGFPFHKKCLERSGLRSRNCVSQQAHPERPERTQSRPHRVSSPGLPTTSSDTGRAISSSPTWQFAWWRKYEFPFLPTFWRKCFWLPPDRTLSSLSWSHGRVSSPLNLDCGTLGITWHTQLKKNNFLSCFNLVIVTEEVPRDGEMSVEAQRNLSKLRQRNGTECLSHIWGWGGSLLVLTHGLSIQNKGRVCPCLSVGGRVCLIFMVTHM